MSRIAIVVPSIREDSWREFISAWDELFVKHQVCLIKVTDGDHPTIDFKDYQGSDPDFSDSGKTYDKYETLIFNYNSGVRNLGFLFIADHLKYIDYVISLDDDVRPYKGNDPIQQHLDILDVEVIHHPKWINTSLEIGVRGLPYTSRYYEPVKLSHGVWHNIPDYDAITQLYTNNYISAFWKGILPKDKFMSICSMNFAFSIDILESVYQAPMGPKLVTKYGLPEYNRFEDIWGGIGIIEDSVKENWSIATGFSEIEHIKASNVWVNLKKESVGLNLNEDFYIYQTLYTDQTTDPYLILFNERRNSYKECIRQLTTI